MSMVNESIINSAIRTGDYPRISILVINGAEQKKNGKHRKSGGEGTESFERQSHVFLDKVAAGGKVHTKRDPDGGEDLREQVYIPPVLVNPGNTIKTTYTCDEVATLLSEAGDFTHYIVGGGVMGDKLCHENEAPFPESLAEFFIRSFCPPDGVVLDPFSGSGTTVATAVKWGRYGIGCDIRQSQVDLGQRRVDKVVFGQSLPVPGIAA